MSKATMGFIYTVKEFDPSGSLVSVTEHHNLIPIEGLNHIIEVALKNGTPFANLYVGLYEGDYTPTPADTMAAFPTAATELTAYTSTTRPALVLGSVASGQVSNTGTEVEFVGNTNGKQARGGFVCASPTKGSTTGPLLSAVKFPSPKALDSGGKLEVTVVFAAASV